MAFLRISPLFQLEITDDYCGVSSTDACQVLSSAILNGGLTTSTHWFNRRVEAHANEPMPHPADSLRHALDALGWPCGSIGMMTAASMDSCRMRFTSQDGVQVLAVATTGIRNARRIGDPAEVCEWNDHFWQPGTINIAVFTNACLSPAALVEALQLVTEAKTAACHDNDLLSTISGEIATGTGTDASAIFSTIDGMPVHFCGKHMALGEMIGSLTYDVVSQGIQACYRAQRKADTAS